MTKDIPTNTTNLPASDVVARALVAPDTYITDMEAQGQAELVNSDVLPRIYGHSGTELQAERQAFADLGFTFGDPVPGDDLFVHATIPAGWKREGSEHAMWSYLLDERGIRRVAIFYKAAYYDRDAFMRLTRPGCDAASDWIYGDSDTLTLNPLLTADELADARTSAQSYLADAERYPDIYGDRAPRAQALLDACP